jgi:hypothetical protein
MLFHDEKISSIFSPTQRLDLLVELNKYGYSEQIRSYKEEEKEMPNKCTFSDCIYYNINDDMYCGLIEEQATECVLGITSHSKLKKSKKIRPKKCGEWTKVSLNTLPPFKEDMSETDLVLVLTVDCCYRVAFFAEVEDGFIGGSVDCFWEGKKFNELLEAEKVINYER